MLQPSGVKPETPHSDNVGPLADRKEFPARAWKKGKPIIAMPERIRNPGEAFSRPGNENRLAEERPDIGVEGFLIHRRQVPARDSFGITSL